jgi:hypothetical protein
MTQMLFPEIAQQIQASIAELESELESINQSRKDKKAELKRAQKSYRAFSGQNSAPKKRKGAAA